MWIELHKVSGVNAGAFSAKLKPVKLQQLHRRGPAKRISLGQGVVIVLIVLHLVRCF